MKQSELIERIYASQGGKVSKAGIKDTLEALGSVATNALAAGDDVPLAGLGKLKPSTRAARAGRNIRTGEPITIAARKVVKFSASSALSGKIA